MTGDLAVTNSCDGPEGSCYPSGTVLIYMKAKGRPKAFTDPFTAQMFYCVYDKAGNLFVNGGSAFRIPISFAELPKRGATFRKIKLTLVGSPGGLQWTDTHLAVGRADGNAIYQYDTQWRSRKASSRDAVEGHSKWLRHEPVLDHRHHGHRTSSQLDQVSRTVSSSSSSIQRAVTPQNS